MKDVLANRAIELIFCVSDAHSGLNSNKNTGFLHGSGESTPMKRTVLKKVGITIPAKKRLPRNPAQHYPVETRQQNGKITGVCSTDQTTAIHDLRGNRKLLSFLHAQPFNYSPFYTRDSHINLFTPMSDYITETLSVHLCIYARQSDC